MHALSINFRLELRILRFGPFEADLHAGELRKQGMKVKLQEKPFQVLALLLERPGELATREELRQQLWPADTFVDFDHSVGTAVAKLRQAVGDSAHNPRFVETVSSRGYRFIAPVTEVFPTPAKSKVLADQPLELGSGELRTSNRLRGSLGGALVGLITGAVLVALVLGLDIGGARVSLFRSSNPTVRSLAVLPLENLSGDPAQDYFADGMTESFIGNLAQIRALKVISRTSIMRYKGSRKSLPDIAHELNVDAVIEGTVQRSGGRVRVTAVLIHAATDTHLWAREYERDLTDVLKLQSEVARAVADEIRIHLTADERARLTSARSVDPQAHEAYLLGRHHLSKLNEQDLKQAIGYFERAIQLAPDFAAAYAGLSDAWVQLGVAGADLKEVESPSRAAALKAIALDAQLAEAHISLGNIRLLYDWDWAGAEHELRHAVEIDPGGLDPHVHYGHLLMHLGRRNEAIAEGRIAAQLDPLSSTTQSALGRFLYRARKYGEALPHLQRAVELEPRSAQAHFRLGDLYAQLGRFDDAVTAYRRVGELSTKGEDSHAEIARVYALMGRTNDARQMISGVNSPAVSVAAVYAALGDRDEAFKILQKAVGERQGLVALKEDPPFESLHSDSRWKVLLGRMNFPPE